MTPDVQVDEEQSGHVRRALTSTRELVRIAYRDPEHIAERLSLLASHNLSGEARDWAQKTLRENPHAKPEELAGHLRATSANIARIDGAVAGTPFFIALVPGYIAYLWQEARMTLRTAALFGRDPATLRTTAEMLALRGVHPTVEEAEVALRAVPDEPPPIGKRRSLRFWYETGKRVLVFGGFLGPPSGEPPPSGAVARLRAGAAFVFGALIWVTTWVVPVTFMILMAWGCETHSRQLGLRALELYGEKAATTKDAIAAARRVKDPGHGARQVLRSAALVLSIAIPIGFIVYADHIRQHTGVNWLGAIGALVALSLVIAASVYGRRR